MRSRLVITLGIAALAAAALASAQNIDAGTRAAAQRIAVGTCAACHGPRGHSIAPKFPVLAGQRANYLVAQMQAFKAQTRGDADAIGYMWGMAAPLSDDLIVAVADYYSRQSPRAGAKGRAAVVARGQKLYQRGDPALGVPACGACHGPAAEGNDIYPRLAGQHVQYLIKQLRSFKNNMRNVAVMHGVVQELPLDDMEAVATYLQSLGP